MSIESQLRAAKSPQEAMLVLARGLDQIMELVSHQAVAPEDWFTGEWSPSEVPSRSGPPVQITELGDNTLVEIAPPSPEKLERRRQFERDHLRLHDALGGAADGDDWADVYAKGGPMWLYVGNRELFMSYPDETRAAMVQDVLEDDPASAHEMGRDVLKQPMQATGFGKSPALADEFEGGV